MAYEARRNDDNSKEAEDAKSNASNQKAVQVAAEAASKSGNAYAAAIGKGVQIADKVSGGKASEMLGKGLTKANKIAPGGKTVQKATNKLADSKMADKAMDAYSAKNGNGAQVADKAAKAKEGAEKAQKAKEQADKAAKTKENAEKAAKAKEEAAQSASKNSDNGGGESGGSSPSSDTGDNKSSTKGVGIAAVGVVFPIILAILPIIFIVAMVSVVMGFADYDDAFGISEATGGDTGGVDGSASDPEQRDFYNRVIEVQNEFQAEGKTVDPLMVVSVYHALNLHDVNLTYKDMSKSRIVKIANAMFDEDNMYNEEQFKSKLKSSIIPSYFPFATKEDKEGITAEVFEYVSRYNALIGKDSYGCSSGNCTYNIKGFYITGSNIKKELNVNDLYVRLMQCGTSDGHNYGGTYGKPLEGEELVPFEKYILGVAYQEIGTGVSEEAFKAQMIAARSYILARPTQMGSATKWRKIEKESDGKWVIQVASCTADQVYCDPDKGCSSVGGDGQWKQVHSGTSSGKTIKGPLSQDSPYRDYAKEVNGEVLVNNQGYVVLTDYTNVETQKFASLSKNGYDYKQILMQVYSNKYPGAGSLDIYKADCGKCVENKEAAKWKQYEGEWTSVQLGNSGKTIKQIGCLATSLAIQIARSGVQTNVSNFNPGTFVTYLNGKNAFSTGGALLSYDSVSSVAPSFKYQGYIDVKGKSKENKLNTIKNVVNQQGVYAVAEVKGDTGQHWVAIESVSGDTIKMMDPGSTATNMWDQYNWANTSRIVYYKVS